jgi:Complex I intermediate-associated protein 30 (CIA30)/Carbohydrate binding domain (family 11)
MNDLRLSPILLMILTPACITAPHPAADGPTASSGSGAASGEALLLDDFESSSSKAGQPWSASADQNNLGSAATFAVEDGGKIGKAAHFTGKLGRNVAPWPWASLSTGVAMGSKGDLSGVAAVRFWVKGDGKKYRLALSREAVTDFANFAKTFQAPSEWTQMEIPLDALRQAAWGKQIDRAWKDVKALEFAPLDAEQDFDLRIDNVELVLAAGGSPPFGENAKVIDEPQTPLEGTTYVLDQFEAQSPANGGVWGSEMDMNNLGTIATARTEDSGDEQKHAIHLAGKLGKNGPPWPWATLAVNLEPNANLVDLSHVKGIRFKARGDGKPYKVAITRKAVTDYGTFSYTFSPSKAWKQYSVPLSKLKQPDWAKQVEPGWADSTSLQFQPTIGAASFDLWIDDVELVFETGKPIPFKK